MMSHPVEQLSKRELLWRRLINLNHNVRLWRQGANGYRQLSRECSELLKTGQLERATELYNQTIWWNDFNQHYFLQCLWELAYQQPLNDATKHWLENKMSFAQSVERPSAKGMAITGNATPSKFHDLAKYNPELLVKMMTTEKYPPYMGSRDMEGLYQQARASAFKNELDRELPNQTKTEGLVTVKQTHL